MLKLIFWKATFNYDRHSKLLKTREPINLKNLKFKSKFLQFYSSVFACKSLHIIRPNTGFLQTVLFRIMLESWKIRLKENSHSGIFYAVNLCNRFFFTIYLLEIFLKKISVWNAQQNKLRKKNNNKQTNKQTNGQKFISLWSTCFDVSTECGKFPDSILTRNNRLEKNVMSLSSITYKKISQFLQIINSWVARLSKLKLFVR